MTAGGGSACPQDDGKKGRLSVANLLQTLLLIEWLGTNSVVQPSVQPLRRVTSIAFSLAAVCLAFFSMGAKERTTRATEINPEDNYLTGIACLSATDCWAVGQSEYHLML